MAMKYPKNPHFNRLQMRTAEYQLWQEGCAHDPSLLEWEGKFYSFSTDTFGAPSGYQIRRSDDLMHWEYVGSAFDMKDKEKSYVSGKGNLQPAYDWCKTSPSEMGYGIATHENGKMAFWAPHCVRGTDGKFWLYFCLTGYFGGSKSCIGLAKSDSPEGGFLFDSLLVQSPAGWRTPNAIDPQVFFAEGRMFMVYGSFGLGLFLVELDPQTGRRKDGLSYGQFQAKQCSFQEYYGTNLACGSLEGGVIHYHKDVPVLENGTWTTKSYYYLMCSYGSLSTVYNMRCGRSESPEGPYVDVNGNKLVCSTDIGTGNKMLGSFRWQDAAIDFFCPGHNDMFETSGGVNLISYHCRTNYFIEKGLSKSNNFHYLYVAQYAFNSDGWPVMNANRYAGEVLQPITAEELLSVSAGKFEAVLFAQSANPVTSTRVVLNADGTFGGSMRGRWKLYGTNYVSLESGGEEYLGVVMPAWLDHLGTSGLTITAMGKTSGMSLHLITTNKI